MRENAIRRLLSMLTLFVITAFLAVTAADADLWGHLTFGRDIARSGIHRTDPYSFTSDRPWVNHEWLAELVMWRAYAIGGDAGLVTLKLLLIWAAGALLLVSWRAHHISPPWRDALLLATALGVWPTLVTMRPQVFSLACFAVLLFVLVRARDGERAWLALLPPLFAFWVNVHGGWLVGAGVLATFVACSLVDRRLRAADRWALVIASLAAAFATLCNPYGIRMLALLAETVRPQRADILEWQSITALPGITVALWMLPTAVAVAALVRNGRRRDDFAWPSTVHLSSIVIVALLAAGGFRVARLLGFYAAAVAFLLAPAVPPVAPPAHASLAPARRRWAFAIAACALIVGTSVALVGRRVGMDGAWLPEPEAAEYVASHGVRGTMLTWFDYGEYAIWHFAPTIRVSMDGRRETVYSQHLIDLHFRIYRNEPGALDAVGRMDPDYAWLPSTLPVVPALESAGWRRAFTGPRSVILSRKFQPPAVTVRESSARPAFPGE